MEKNWGVQHISSKRYVAGNLTEKEAKNYAAGMNKAVHKEIYKAKEITE